MRHISEEMARSELYAQAFFSSDLERALIKGLILAQPNNYSEALQQGLGGRPPHYLLRAREFLQANAPRDPEPGGRGTRRRGLAVQAVRGLPSLLRGVADEYLTEHYRLAAVREEILAAAAPAASRRSPGLGFSHLGRFSVDYRKRFEGKPRA
ncbi:hypothetical protein IDZ93_32315 [Pseudomonas aeruginosa]|uniref:hypothetical protein n=1 Tax=Pseudomonas aeruginosa TaxID=287 RepID=UPI001ADD44FD|nr:hypothetical protein [Pseudomonas aeruginosa]